MMVSALMKPLRSQYLSFSVQTCSFQWKMRSSISGSTIVPSALTSAGWVRSTLLSFVALSFTVN